MSYTRTMTLEELALARLCSGEPVRLASGPTGRITEIAQSLVDPGLRRICVVESGGRVHNVDLKYGAVEF
jgi:hypothetical protein